MKWRNQTAEIIQLMKKIILQTQTLEVQASIASVVWVMHSLRDPLLKFLNF